jgi:hypothetical protein
MRRNGTVSWFGSIAGEMLLILFVVALVPQVWQAEARRLRAQSRFEDMDEVELAERNARRATFGDPVPRWQWERLEPADLDATGEYTSDLVLPAVRLPEGMESVLADGDELMSQRVADKIPVLRERPPRIPLEGSPRSTNRMSPDRLPRNRLPR